MADITYRTVRESDFDAMHRIVSHWDVVRQLGGWPWPPDPDFTRTRAQAYKGNGFVWAICDDDRLIGTMAVTGGELGYYLDPARHGQRIMRRAMAKAILEAFEVLDRDTLFASTWIDNDASHGLLVKAGFFHYRTEYIRSKARGYPVLVRQYRLPRPVWERLRTAAQ